MSGIRVWLAAAVLALGLADLLSSSLRRAGPFLIELLI